MSTSRHVLRDGVWQGSGPALLAAVALGLVAVLSAAMAADAPPAAPGAPAADPPAAPAFYTQGISRIREIKGDSFTFMRDDGKAVRVRLIDADVAPCGESARVQAGAVATKFFEETPVWVFPVGRSADGSEVWADVWTPKGWLSQVLVRAGYAQPRTEPALSTLSPPDAAGASNKGPAPVAPAFQTAVKPKTGDTFDIEQGTRKHSVRLFDAACEGADQASSAPATATRLLGGPVWVFPCASPPVDGKGDWPVRIWTVEGWLSDVLVKAGQAKHVDGSAKPATAVAAKPETAPKPAPVKPAVKKPPETAIEWKTISVTLSTVAPDSEDKGAGTDLGVLTGNANASHLESQVFKITTGAWRVSWEMKTAVKGSRPMIQVLRCGTGQTDTTVKTPSTQVISSTQAVGGQVLRTAPGNYWIKVGGTTTATVKVEEATKKEVTP